MCQKAGIYIRAASRQADLLARRDKLTKFCAEKGWEVAGVYTDIAPGNTLDRPGLSQLITDVDKLNVVVVAKLSELSRDVKAMTNLIDIVFSNVDVVSVEEPYDRDFFKTLIDKWDKMEDE